MNRLFCLILLAAAACTADSKPSAKKYRFALVPKMLNNEVFNYGKIGAEKTAQEIEAKEGVKIEILWNAPLQSDPAQQASIVESYVGQKVDGISVACSDANAIRKAIDRAADANIPIMTFDSDSPESKRRAFFGTDDIECGQILAKTMGDMIKKGKVVIQTGTAGAPNLELRVKGAKDELAKNYPDIQVTDVLFCNDDVKKAIDDIASYLSAHPDISGILMVGGWALFGKDALKSVDPAKTKVVAVDALPAMWAYVESGKCQALIAQDLWGWGEQSVRILKAMADKKPFESGDRGVVNGKLEVVTASNIAEYKKQWVERFGAPK